MGEVAGQGSGSRAKSTRDTGIVFGPTRRGICERVYEKGVCVCERGVSGCESGVRGYQSATLPSSFDLRDRVCV